MYDITILKCSWKGIRFPKSFYNTPKIIAISSSTAQTEDLLTTWNKASQAEMWDKNAFPSPYKAHTDFFIVTKTSKHDLLKRKTQKK